MRRKTDQRLTRLDRYGERMAFTGSILVRMPTRSAITRIRRFSVRRIVDYRHRRGINQNLPYNQFVCRSNAGDLWTNPDDRSIDRSDTHRFDQRGRRERCRAKDVLCDLFCETVCGMFPGIHGCNPSCAQCHDHKYDSLHGKAISSSDSCVFADLQRSGKLRRPQSSHGNSPFPRKPRSNNSNSLTNKITLAFTGSKQENDATAGTEPSRMGESDLCRRLDAETKPNRVGCVGRRSRTAAKVREPDFVSAEERPGASWQRSRRQTGDQIVFKLFLSSAKKTVTVQSDTTAATWSTSIPTLRRSQS